MASHMRRRSVLKLIGGGALGSFAAGTTRAMAAPAVGGKPIELVHWSWFSASDAEVWKQLIDNFNVAHKDKGIQIRHEVVPLDQYGTTILASAATGNAPDF